MRNTLYVRPFGSDPNIERRYPVQVVEESGQRKLHVNGLPETAIIKRVGTIKANRAWQGEVRDANGNVSSKTKPYTNAVKADETTAALLLYNIAKANVRQATKGKRAFSANRRARAHNRMVSVAAAFNN